STRKFFALIIMWVPWPRREQRRLRQECVRPIPPRVRRVPLPCRRLNAVSPASWKDPGCHLQQHFVTVAPSQQRNSYWCRIDATKRQRNLRSSGEACDRRKREQPCPLHLQLLGRGVPCRRRSRNGRQTQHRSVRQYRV